ncbi:MAG: hypothetical protein FJ145_13375 [Deltaproteobacteria bacterium]|nr:hypothetical protein [Deltaproteobacteria bacterium]
MAQGEKLSVLNPMGCPPKITPKAMAPRLDSLDGKTVYLVDPRFDDSGLFLRQMQNWFAEHLPSVQTKLVEMNNVYTKDDPKTWDYQLIQNYIYPRATFGEEPYASKLKAAPDQMIRMFKPEEIHVIVVGGETNG